MKLIDLDDLLIALDKEEELASMEGRNHAYSKGIRKAMKIAESMKDYTEEADTSHAVKGGIQREGTWWYQCEKCFTSINPSDTFCRKCGRRIIWDESV